MRDPRLSPNCAWSLTDSTRRSRGGRIRRDCDSRSHPGLRLDICDSALTSIGHLPLDCQAP